MKDKYDLSIDVIGYILSIGTVFGLILSPIMGYITQKTKTKYGKNMPYIFLSLPIGGIIIIMAVVANNLILTLVFLYIFCFTFSVSFSPSLAIITEFTTPKNYTKANSVLTFAAGSASVMSWFIGGMITNIYGPKGVFIFCGVMLITLTTVEFILVKLYLQKRIVSNDVQENKVKNKSESSEKLSKYFKICIVLFLLVLFLYTNVFNAIQSFLTLYLNNIYGVAEGNAGIILSLFAIFYVIVAIPFGKMANKYDIKNLLYISFFITIIAATIILLVNNLIVAVIAIIVLGICWALFTVISLPLLFKLGDNKNQQRLTGLYTSFAFISGIFTPAVLGNTIKISGNNYNSVFGFIITTGIIGLFVSAILFKIFKKQDN